MNHQFTQHAGLRFTALLIAAIMTTTTCLTSWPFTDTGSYAYAAEAEASSKNAAETPVKNAAEVPGKITGLKLEVTSSPTATLTWNKIDCDGYKVYRGSKAIARVKAGEADDIVTYTDEEIEPGASCTYLVRPFKTVNGEEVYGAYSPAVKIVEGYTYTSADDTAAASPTDAAAANSAASVAASPADAAAAASGIKLTGYTGRDKKLVIPDKLDGRKVTEIGDRCFSGNAWPERIYVPEGVEKIGDYSFECCTHLQKVYLPDTVKTVGNGAFSGCGELKLADLGDGVTEIGDGAFMACLSLKQIEFPAHLKTLGKFAFSFCRSLSVVDFAGEEIETIPERAFHGCESLQNMTLPASVTKIGKRAFFGSTQLEYLRGRIALKEIGDYAFEGTHLFNVMPILDDEASLGFGVFAKNEVDRYFDDSFQDGGKHTDLRDTATLAEGVFYGSPINGIGMYSSGEGANYKLVDGSLYTADGKTLVVYFPTMRNEDYEFVKTKEAEQKVFHVPEGVTRIAPYAFFECGLEQIYLPPTVTEISGHAFTRSGIAPDLGMITDYDGNEIGSETEGIAFSDSAFENWSLTHNYGLEAAAASKDSEDAASGPFPDLYRMTSLAGDKSIYRSEDFDGFTDIFKTFDVWCRDYIEDNKARTPMDDAEDVPTFCSLYKSDDHFEQMASAQNGDTGWIQGAIAQSGHEYEEMYLMADHGLSTELSRAKVHGNLILYSGITDSFVERIAGVSPGTEVSTEDLIGRIGSVCEEKAIMSTSASFDVSYWFREEHYGAMLFILAPQDAMNSLGTYCIDCFIGANGNGGEREILFDAGSRLRILDVGTAEREMSGELRSCTYSTVELLSDEGGQDTYEPLDEELGKTGRGDIYNLANNVKVTWKEVPGAKYYKVYREGVTDPSETPDEPVIVTSKLVGWDKQPGLKSGHAYRYRIVASLTGAGDPSGDSSLSYCKLMYRLKTVAIRSVKNTAPGKITVKYDKTADGDSYVLQYSEHEDMTGAKTLVVNRAENTSRVIGGLKKGKTYYVSIRVRKKVDGINYYTTFGVPKKVVITQ